MFLFTKGYLWQPALDAVYISQTQMQLGFYFMFVCTGED